MQSKGTLTNRYVAYRKQDLSYKAKNFTNTPEIAPKINVGIKVSSPVRVPEVAKVEKSPMLLKQLITAIWNIGINVKKAIRNFFIRKVKK